MSDMAMKYEDWLRGCVYHDGRKGNVYLPCDTVLEIADWIEAHRDAVQVVRCKDCKWWTKQEKSIQGRCALTGTYPTGGWYCGNGERKDNE